MRLSHKLMHVLPLLVWVWVTDTILLDRSVACGLHIAVQVSTNRIGQACSHARADKLNPAIVRMRWPRCHGQASWLIRLNIVHAIQCAS